MTKKISIILFAVMCSVSLFAQKMPGDYFTEAVNCFEKKEYQQAEYLFKYVVDHYPKNQLRPRSFYNLGICYLQEKKPDSAISVFKAILASDFNEKESLGGGIMDDPYANYKHRASELLSDIYFELKMFDTALYYFSMSDSVYAYMHFCGNEYAENDVRTALRYSEIFRNLGRKQQAIAALLPAVLIRLADNSEVISELKTLLKGQKGVINDLDRALQNAYVKTVNAQKNNYRTLCIKFLDTDIHLATYYDEKEKIDTKKEVAYFKKSTFYEMISQL